jgi:hypothetical protein
VYVVLVLDSSTFCRGSGSAVYISSAEASIWFIPYLVAMYA